jgi:REP element-mobilizing transposase RayT
VIAASLEAVKERGSLRVVHFAVLGNHLHLIVEADDRKALALGMSGLMIRVAKRLNRMMGSRGRVFDDHYHSHPLRSPTEATRAIAYVVTNYARHAERRGDLVDQSKPDPFSSAAAANRALVFTPGTWILGEGRRRGARARA